MDINVLYEDEYVIALDKPSGLIVHKDGRTDEYSLTDWIITNRPEVIGVGEDAKSQNGEVIERPGIVHRLDKDTSGVILIPKTEESFAFIKEQFQKKEIQKIYRAVVWGKFKIDTNDLNNKIFTIDKPIGRSASDFRKWSAEFGAKGELREALTLYKILYQDEEKAYLEVYPKTGRTHQIRVHLKSIGHPVVCDLLYSKNVCNKDLCFGFDRLALHALSVKFRLPNNVSIEIVSPLPNIFNFN